MRNKKVGILSGVSGSGKSHYANGQCMIVERAGGRSSIVSADDFFMVDGVYTFDPTKLSEAHGLCFRAYIELLNSGLHMRFSPEIGQRIIVDNTNTTAIEIAPYVLAAQAYGWEVEIITIWCNERVFDKVAARNVHGVPYDSVGMQHQRIVDRILPPWWKSTTIEPDFE